MMESWHVFRTSPEQMWRPDKRILCMDHQNEYVQSIPKECLALNTGSNSRAWAFTSFSGRIFHPDRPSRVWRSEILDTRFKKNATLTDNSKHFSFFVDAPPSLLHLTEAGCALHLPRWFYRKVFASEELHRDGLIVREDTRKIYKC